MILSRFSIQQAQERTRNLLIALDVPEIDCKSVCKTIYYVYMIQLAPRATKKNSNKHKKQLNKIDE